MTRTNPPKKVRTRTTKPVTLAKKKAGRIGHWKSDMIQRVFILATLGLTDYEIAVAFGVDINTINNWKRTKPKFMEALQKGKDEADNKVEKAFYQRAIGYSHPDVHISNYKGEITVTPITKHYPPDPFSCLKWLTIRKRKEWAELNKTAPLFNLNMLVQNFDFSDFTEEEMDFCESIGMKRLMESIQNKE